MSDAPVDSVSSASQQATRLDPLYGVQEPEEASSGAVSSQISETVLGQTSKAVGSEESDGSIEDEPDGAKKATQRDVKSEKTREVPERPTEEEVTAVELAVVKAAVEVTTKKEAASDPTPPEEEPDTERGSSAESSTSGRSSRQGYGTFDQPAPTRPEDSAGTLSTVTEEETLPSESSPARDLSNFMTFMNLMRASMGTGILAMPMAIRNAGMAVGPPLFIFIAFICTYCIHLLVNSSRTLRRRLRIQTLEYADTAAAACETSRWRCVRGSAKLAKFITNTSLVVFTLGTCSVYVLFVKENLKQLFDVSCKENEWSAVDYSLHLALILLVLVAIPNLSGLSIVSTIANLTMFVGLVMCMVIVCTPQVDTTAPQLEYNRTMDTWANTTVHNVTIEQWAGVDRLPLFFGTAVFALEGIGMVMTLENRMKDPANFLKIFGVLNVAMFIMTAMYAVVGSFGYKAYGEKTKGSITLNLPPDSTLAFWVRKLVTLAIFLTYPVQFYIAEEILWKLLISVRKSSCCERLCQRFLGFLDWVEQHLPGLLRNGFKVLLMLSTVALPLGIRRLGPFIALVGAVCLSMLGLILPTAIDATTHWDDIKLPKMVFHVVILLVGILGLCFGAYSAIVEMKELDAATL